jgi:hypothetical protein
LEPIIVAAEFFHSALSLRLLGEDVTTAAREAAVQKKSGTPTPKGPIDSIDNTIDPGLEEDAADGDIEVWS